MSMKLSAVEALFAGNCAVFGPRLMKEFHLTDFQAAGVFGNLGHESGGFQHMQELRPISGRGGLGWCQWTGPRRRTFEAYLAKHGLKPSSDEGNFGYLVSELHGIEAGAITALRQAHDLSHATDAFCRHFERPGIVNLSSRLVWANKALVAIRRA